MAEAAGGETLNPSKRGAEFRCGLIAISQVQGQALTQHRLERVGYAGVVVFFERVLRHAVDGDRGRAAGDHPVERRRRTVDVRPRPLLAVALVLLQRRVALGEHHRHTAVLAGKVFPRRTKVQQDRLADGG